MAQLRTFATIAEFGHFGTAATHLGISQPSLSQALAALEAGLGVQLIERSTRKVIVTAIGRALLPFAQATLESLDAFVNNAHGVKGGLVGSLTMGLIPTIAPYILADFLKIAPERASELFPHIVEDKTPDLVEGLKSGNLEVAVVGGLLDRENFYSIPLFTEEFVLVVPEHSPLAGRDNLVLADLHELNIMLLDDGHCLTEQVVELCRIADIKKDPRQSITRAVSLTTVMQLVSAGMGSTLVPMSAVAVECTRPGLAFGTFANGLEKASRSLVLAYRSSTTRSGDYVELGDILSGAIEAADNRSREFLAQHRAG